MADGQERIKRLRGAFLILGILGLGGIIFMFSFRRQQSVSDQSVASVTRNDATLALQGIRHTDIRKGVNDWVLDAESADYRLEENITYLSELKAKFFDNNGENVFLSAESGIWKTDSNDLEVSGDVVLKNSQYEMYTERLNYNESERIFVTHSPVTIHGVLWEQTARGMTYSLDSEQIFLDGNVEGEFGNDIEF